MMVILTERWIYETYEYGNQNNDFATHRKQMEADGWQLLSFDLEFGKYRKQMPIDTN